MMSVNADVSPFKVRISRVELPTIVACVRDVRR